MKNLLFILILISAYAAKSQKKHWINTRENVVESKSLATAYFTKVKIKDTENYHVKYYKLDGTIYQEQVFDTENIKVKNGKNILYNSKGDTATIGSYKSNKKDREWVYYNDSKTIITKINFLENKREGKTVELNANGDTILFGNYHNGLEHGKWSYFDDEKTIFRTLNYNKGILDGEQILFYKNKRPREITKFSQGRHFSTKLFNQEGEELDDNYEYFLFDHEPIFPSPYGNPPVSLQYEASFESQERMNSYLQRNIKYPQIARENGLRGRVYVSFDVEEDGSITNVKSVYPPSRKPHESLEKEALRVINSMPKFIPAVSYGKRIKMKQTQPIDFRL